MDVERNFIAWQATHADSPQGATLGLSALAWRFRGYDAYVRTVPREPGKSIHFIINLTS